MQVPPPVYLTGFPSLVIVAGDVNPRLNKPLVILSRSAILSMVTKLAWFRLPSILEAFSNNSAFS
jgi:hypothetical protein